MSWIVNRQALTENQRINNATEVYNYFKERGWSHNAIVSLLGNMDFESTINPGVIEGYTTVLDPTLGYGLIQWTDINATTLSGNPLHYWIETNYGDDDWDNGTRQCTFINTDDRLFWIRTANYYLTYDEFKVSEMSVDYLTKAYFYNRERGTWSDLRLEYANKWNDHFKEPIPPIPPTPPTPSKNYRSMPIYYYDLF